MPVYVTRAHVTIGDANKKHKPLVPKRSFHISDIFQTPYCIRTFLISFLGLAIVTGGVLMTIIGYKPGILLPWYKTLNYTHYSNTTEPTSVPNVLGEPGPLRILVYIGPVCMGVGFFGMMMSIVLFCEIKDRYLNNIKPKLIQGEDPKTKMYDKIIEEFRKNYFRGIEVPLKKIVTERRKSRHRFSLSLSQSGSIVSFGRRLSQDLQRRFRRASKESQTERATENKFKRSTLRRIIDPESWMKTSSLPNIRQKDSFVELREIYDATHLPSLTSKRTSRSCDPNLNIFKISGDTSGVDNPAFKDSPQDKRREVSPNDPTSIQNTASNRYVTTVLVHRESNNDELGTSISRQEGTCSNRGSGELEGFRCVSSGSGDCVIEMGNSYESIIDINSGINIQFGSNDDTVSIPGHETNVSNTSVIDMDLHNICKCSTGESCPIHSEGFDSDGSSLTLSWDNVPSEWSEARRNTEPVVTFPMSFNTEESILNRELNGARRKSSVTSSQIRHKEVIKSRSTGEYDERRLQLDEVDSESTKKCGPFVRKIGVCKSDTNLLRVGPYSLLGQTPDDSSSGDSLDLTDEMLKNFEMIEEAYI